MRSDDYIAVIDFGSNSTRLLITRIDDIFNPVVEKVTVTRLSEGAFMDHMLQSEPMKRTLTAAKEHLNRCSRFTDKVYAFGTNILREAMNSDFFAEKCKKELDLDLAIISGEHEAFYNYLAVKEYFKDIRNPLAFDLGGGSIELIWYDTHNYDLQSLPIGCVRFLSDWDSGSFRDIETKINTILNDCRINGSFSNIIGIGGTATTLASVDIALPYFIPDEVQGHSINIERMKQLYTTIAELDVEERKKLPGMDPPRADTLPCGCFIIMKVMEHFSAHTMLASHYDLMHGYALAKSQDLDL